MSNNRVESVDTPTIIYEENGRDAKSTEERNNSLQDNGISSKPKSFINQNNSKHSCKQNGKSIISWIENLLSSFFYNYGRSVSTHPIKVIVLCLVFTLVCSLGLLNFRKETNGIQLWIPESSDLRYVSNVGM